MRSSPIRHFARQWMFRILLLISGMMMLSPAHARDYLVELMIFTKPGALSVPEVLPEGGEGLIVTEEGEITEEAVQPEVLEGEQWISGSNTHLFNVNRLNDMVLESQNFIPKYVEEYELWKFEEGYGEEFDEETEEAAKKYFENYGIVIEGALADEFRVDPEPALAEESNEILLANSESQSGEESEEEEEEEITIPFELDVINITPLKEQLLAADYQILYEASWQQPSAFFKEAPVIAVGAPLEFIRGAIRVYKTSLLYVDISLGMFDPWVDPDYPIYFIHEKRRVKFKEVHYFDNPKFGAIVTVWPEEEEEELDETEGEEGVETSGIQITQ